ncbi:putative membrane protein, partial [Chlamydia psittaci 02DC14]
MKKKSIGKVSTVVALIFAAVSIFVIGLVEGLR